MQSFPTKSAAPRSRRTFDRSESYQLQRMRRLTTLLAFLCLCIIHSHSFRRHETVRNAFAVHLTNNPNNIGASTKKYVNNIFRRVAAVIVTPFLAFKRANAVTSTGITVVPLDYSYNALVLSIIYHLFYNYTYFHHY
jgi:hypothetical protein